MQEVAPAGHDHRHATPVGSLYNLPVALGASGLDDSRYTGLGEGFEAVREWEEGVARRCRSRRPHFSLPYSEVRRLDPTHLARPDTDRHPVPGQHDGVALDALGDLPGEEQVSQLGRSRLHTRGDLIAGFILDPVGALEKEPPRNVLGRALGAV